MAQPRMCKTTKELLGIIIDEGCKILESRPCTKHWLVRFSKDGVQGTVTLPRSNHVSFRWRENLRRTVRSSLRQGIPAP